MIVCLLDSTQRLWVLDSQDDEEGEFYFETQVLKGRKDHQIGLNSNGSILALLSNSSNYSSEPHFVDLDLNEESLANDSVDQSDYSSEKSKIQEKLSLQAIAEVSKESSKEIIHNNQRDIVLQESIEDLTERVNELDRLYYSDSNAESESHSNKDNSSSRHSYDRQSDSEGKHRANKHIIDELASEKIRLQEELIAELKQNILSLREDKILLASLLQNQRKHSDCCTENNRLKQENVKLHKRIRELEQEAQQKVQNCSIEKQFDVIQSVSMKENHYAYPSTNIDTSISEISKRRKILEERLSCFEKKMNIIN